LFAPDRWTRYPPSQRAALLGQAATTAGLQAALLGEVEQGRIPPATLPPPTREALRQSPHPGIQARARLLFPTQPSADRPQALQAAQGALALAGRPGPGREVFRRLCAACHRLDREGVAVGPDLFSIRQQPKETILLHVVIPDLEVAPQFLAYECETRDGRLRTGLLLAETAATITLRQAQGVEEVIPRSQVVRLAAGRSSLMPQGLESGLSTPDLADLLAFLKGE
ncbi:MAG: dehydrogenase, partial [Verrucomicrobiota bacterium]